MRAVVLAGAGGNEIVSVAERPDPAVGPDEVSVAVGFAGLNPADVQQREGSYPPPPGSPADVLGLEVAGSVAGTGDRHGARRARHPVLPPHGRGGAGAGGRRWCRLSGRADRPGRRGAGARLSVRSEAAEAPVRGLGAEPVPDDGCVDAVAGPTQERGADVIVELVGASHFPGNLEVLATRGRIVVVGVGAGSEISLRLLDVMARRATILGTVLRARPLEQEAAAVRAFEREVVPLLADGRARPLIDETNPAEQIRRAFDRLGERDKVGKVLVTFA